MGEGGRPTGRLRRKHLRTKVFGTLEEAADIVNKWFQKYVAV